MKQYLWIIGLAIVILAAFGYAFSGSSESHSTWVISTIGMVVGGIVLIAAYFSYHLSPTKKK